MKLKYIYIVLLLAFGIQQTDAQVYKFLTTGFSVMEKNETSDWGKWSDLKETSTSLFDFLKIKSYALTTHFFLDGILQSRLR